MNNILIIEDDKIKIERLKAFFKNISVTIRESFQSGLSEMKSSFEVYDLLVLDMTIPIWEKGNNDIGGNYEQFGGENILKEMKRKKLTIPTVLFTMFDIFPTANGSITFEEINEQYKKSFPEFYLGGVLYNSNEEDWKKDLGAIIAKLKK